jgi:ATP-dependent exoDNAse (exonuclease V) beta subunit
MNTAEFGAGRKLNDEQRRAVTAERNTVVSAGAGSGKTTVLACRYVRLVVEGLAGVDDILTLTFTRKAAAEMHERIHRMLVEQSALSQVKQELKEFSRAHIATLDSFCAKIVRTDSPRYGIARDFRQDDEECARIARGIAEEMVLSGGDEQTRPGLQELTRLYTMEQIIDELLIPAAASFTAPAGAVQFSDLAERQLELLKGQTEQHINRLLELCTVIEGFAESSSKTVGEAKHTAAVFTGQAVGAAKQGNWTEALRLLADLRLWRKPGLRVKQPDLLLLNDLTDSFRADVSLLRLALLTLSRGELLRSCWQFLSRFQQACIEAKRRAGVLSFSDIALLSVEILRTNRSVRRYFKRRYRYIMIDEFQDNNDLQRQLLYLLSERNDLEAEGVPAADQLSEGKLFFVGDEKQSIYRFRGADVEVFKELKESLERCGGEALSLDTNYRSTPALVAGFNTIFAAVMRGERPYDASFQALLSGLPETADQQPVQIMIHPGDDADEEQEPGEEDELLRPVEAEAFCIASYIRETVEGGLLMLDGEPGRPAGYSDFAVLLRSTSNQMIYERVCRHLGVPYVVQAARALFLEAPVNDIYQLLQLVVYPWDRHAYAALLRSPFAQMSDTSLVQLLRAPQLQPLEDRIFSAEAAAVLDVPGEREKYARVSRLYRMVADMADSAPLTDLIRFIWYRGGYCWHVLRRRANHAYLEYYDYLQGLVRSIGEKKGAGGSPTLVEFLDAVRPKLGENEKADEIDLFRNEQAGVQIMTIHKAKGLEFPVVILADTGNMGIPMCEPLLFSPPRGGEAGPSIAFNERVKISGEQGDAAISNYFYASGRQELARMQEAELQRLLYVAATRAQKKLLITGCWTRRNRGSSSASSCMLGMLMSALGGEPGGVSLPVDIPGIRVDAVPGVSREFYEQSGSGGRGSGVPLEAAAAFYKNTPVISRKPGRQSVTAVELNRRAAEVRGPYSGGRTAALPALGIDPLLDAETAALFGTWCHSLVEHRLGGRAAPGEIRELFAGRSEELIEKISADALLLVEGFFASAVYRTLLSRHDAVVETEVPFLLRRRGVQEYYVRGQIDILVELPDSAVVLDLKSDTKVREHEYREQLQAYLEAAAALTGKPCSGAVIYLRNPEEPVWIS